MLLLAHSLVSGALTVNSTGQYPSQSIILVSGALTGTFIGLWCPKDYNLLVSDALINPSTNLYCPRPHTSPGIWRYVHGCSFQPILLLPHYTKKDTLYNTHPHAALKSLQRDVFIIIKKKAMTIRLVKRLRKLKHLKNNRNCRGSRCCVGLLMQYSICIDRIDEIVPFRIPENIINKGSELKFEYGNIRGVGLNFFAGFSSSSSAAVNFVLPWSKFTN